MTTLTSVGVSAVYNGSITLRATLTSGGTPVAGEEVAFSLGGNTLSQATTDTNGVATLAGVSTTGLDVGNHVDDIIATFGGDSDFDGSSAASDLTLTPAPITVAAGNLSRIYGQANPSLTGTMTGVMNDDNVTASFTTSAGPFSDVQPGGYPITFAGLGGPKALDYSTTVAGGSASPGTLTVTPAPLIITANDLSKVYGQANPAFTATYVGILDGDDVYAIMTTMATQSSDVGGASIDYSDLGGAKAKDYSPGSAGGTYNAGTLSITPAPLTLAADNLAKVYGQANPALTGTVTGILNGDDVAANYATTAGQYSDVVNGGYAITPSGLTGTKAADYSTIVAGGSVTPGTLTVTPAPLTVAIADQSKIYGQANPSLTATVTGVLNGDDVTANLATSAGQYSDVTPEGYAINLANLAGAKAGDYSTIVAGGSVTPGTLTVTPAPLTVAIADQSKIYGQANPALTDTLTGILNGDDVAATLATPAGQYSDVTLGGYAIRLADLTGLKSEDYSTIVDGGSAAPGTLTVTPAPLTVAIDAKNKVYGQANPALTGTIAGILDGDDVAATYTTAATASSDVVSGGYAINASGLSGLKAPDYTIASSTPATLAITPAPLTITADNLTKVYGQANPGLTVSYGGFVLGQAATALQGTLSVATPATLASHVGSDPITPGGLTSADYAITYVPGTLSITPATLIVTPADVTKAYGVAVPTLTATFSGFVNGDSASSLTTPVSLSTPAATDSDFGVYPIVATGGSSADYTIVVNPGTLTVPVNAAENAFVTSIYQSVLGRSPEAAGLDVFLALLNNGATQAEVIGSIYYSPEATAIRAGGNSPTVPTNPGQIGLITAMYQSILNRTPETSGLDGWLAKLNAGESPSDIAAQIENSPEAVAVKATGATPATATQAAQVGTITGLYQTILNRTPDAPGLQGWLAKLDQGASPSDIASQIEGSPEALGGKSPVTVAANPGQVAFITSLYESELGRAPGDYDLSFWGSALDDGETPANVAVQIANSPEALTFRAGLKTTPITESAAYAKALAAEQSA